MKFFFDPRTRYNYASYYILGCMRLPQSAVSYSVTPFISLVYNDIHDYNSGVPFIIDYGERQVKVFICFEDVAHIFEDRYDWCDIYAMVNPTEEQVENYGKLLPIGPEFGVTLGSIFYSFFTFVKNYVAGHGYSSISPKIYLRDYLYTNIRRRPIGHYERKYDVRKNYVFHASTLWYNDFAASDTNLYRGEFLKACKNAGLTIEGGLYYINDKCVLAEMPDYPRYKELYRDFIYESRLSMDDYIKKTKESVLVFNTPSVCGCHGWKLGEYLCMGKAIISSPLTRVMPGEGLIHGKNVHFVTSPDKIYDAIQKIVEDDDYRCRLEMGARAYYEKYLAPDVIIRRIIEKASLEAASIV